MLANSLGKSLKGKCGGVTTTAGERGRRIVVKFPPPPPPPPPPHRLISRCAHSCIRTLQCWRWWVTHTLFRAVVHVEVKDDSAETKYEWANDVSCLYHHMPIPFAHSTQDVPKQQNWLCFAVTILKLHCMLKKGGQSTKSILFFSGTSCTHTHTHRRWGLHRHDPCGRRNSCQIEPSHLITFPSVKLSLSAPSHASFSSFYIYLFCWAKESTLRAPASVYLVRRTSGDNGYFLWPKSTNVALYLAGIFKFYLACTCFWNLFAACRIFFAGANLLLFGMQNFVSR